MIKNNFSSIISVVSLLAILCFLVTGCSSFIPDEDSERISLKYQAGEYVLLEDLKRNDKTFTKNSVVKLLVVTSDDWIKVYAYNSSEALLDSTRLLLLYMFEDDFPDEKFNQELFDKELKKFVRFKDPAEKPEKEVKKQTKKQKKVKK